MTAPGEGGSGAEGARRSEAERRRRRAEVFGDVLPESTRDDRDPERPADSTGDSAGDEWLRNNVPPHHG